jgi:V/A-type H+-transporting ATPase subunit C
MSSGGVAAYSAVHARVRAMYSRMLTSENRARLCEAATLAALVAGLGETIYGPYLAKVADKDLTPRRAIYQIQSHLANAYLTVIRLVPKHARSLLSQLYRRFEVDNLKAVLRGVATGAAWGEVRYVLFPVGSFSILPAQAMMEAGSVAAAVERLRGTIYYHTLEHAMKRYSAEQNLFPLEVALDLDYWRELWEDVGRLSKRDRVQALHIVGSLVDVNNLMWAIRYRVYHHLSEEEIINYTLPFGYKVRDTHIRAIAAGADIARILAQVFPDLTGVESLLQEPESGLPELELRLQRYLVERCEAAFVGYPFHIGIPLAYVVLNELEIQDLTVLVEAKALQVPSERFEPRLLMGCASTPMDGGR